MLKYILATIVLLLLWAASFVFLLPLWIPILSSVAIVAFLVFYVLIRRMKEKRAAKKIEDAINGQAEEDADTLRPERSAEIRSLQAEFNRALQSLKSSRLAKGGKHALAALPWYLIIGPPGAGKSTALRNCGLKFPNISGTGRGGGIRGVGGTRNCEWWMTNQGILLDTAGRYTTEEDDRDEWFSFLDMLRESRAKKPINGILVAVSVTDFMDCAMDEVIEKARLVRDRIDEAMERLRTVVPVYVLFTKCDLIAGFTETFGGLRKKERGQSWGFTLPLDTGGLDHAELFHDHFEELLAVLETRAMGRMSEALNQEMREKVFAFPQEFSALRDPLAEFVNELFVENVYQDTPILRGVYFTSGTQEGKPIDRVMAKVGEAFGVRKKALAMTSAVEAKSYFLYDPMTQVVFPDQDIAFSNKKNRRRSSLTQWLIASICVAVGAGVFFLGYSSYAKNRAMVAETLEMAQKAVVTGAESGLTIGDLAPLGVRIDQLHLYDREGAPWGMRFGMYQGSALLGALRGFYASAIRQTIFDPVLAQDLDEMTHFVSRYQAANSAPDARDFVRLFDKLKLHLLLSRPKAEGEPGLGEAEQAFIVDNIATRRVRGARKKDDVLSEHVLIYLRLLQGDPSLAVIRADDLVKRVRQVLRRTRLDRLVLDKLIADLNRDEYNIGLPEIVGYGVTCLSSSVQIRGAFTRRAWEKKVRGRLAKAGEIEDRWVLGGDTVNTDSKQASEQQLAELRAQYFQQYRDEWRRFIESIQLRSASSGPEALALLQELTDTKPFATLATEVERNTHLEDLSTQIAARANGLASRGLAGRVRGKLGLDKDEPDQPRKKVPTDDRLATPEDLELYFVDFVRFVVPTKDENAPKRPPPMEMVQEHLEYIRDDLKTYLDTEAKDPTPVENRINVAKLRFESLFQAAGPRWRPRYSAWLSPLLEFTGNIVKGVGGTAVNGKWCSELYQPYLEVMANRYPFAKMADDEVLLSSFAKFYAPTEGKIWKFVDAELKTKVDLVGDHYVLKDKGSVHNTQLLAFLGQSRAITAAMFPEGAPKASVRFAVQIPGVPGVAEISLEIDGQKVVYRNGPLEWNNFTWPGDGRKSNAVLRIKGTGIDDVIATDGEWALFRLLDQAVMREEGNLPTFSATWSMRHRTTEVRLIFRPAQRDNPFVSLRDDYARYKLLRAFRGRNVFPPSSIAKGARCD